MIQPTEPGDPYFNVSCSASIAGRYAYFSFSATPKSTTYFGVEEYYSNTLKNVCGFYWEGEMLQIDTYALEEYETTGWTGSTSLLFDQFILTVMAQYNFNTRNYPVQAAIS